MKKFDLCELEELEKIEIVIDVDKLAKSKIKKLVLPLHRFIEWQGIDLDGNVLSKTDLFVNCLNYKDLKKAKQLNKIYRTQIWNLLDDDIKKDMSFKDFVG